MKMNKIFIFNNYKSKIFCFSSLLLTTSIVCPLTSCGGDGTSNDIGEFDKEFGFDAQTYNNLERQFTSKYAASLRNKYKDDDEYTNKFENFLKNDLAILRNKLFDPAQNYSFTFRTNTLLDYASTNFNINLNRNANVSQIDFDNLKQSSLENFVIYMENMGFTNVEIDEKKIEFNNKFDEILEKCKSKTTDNVQILMQLRADVIDCWQDLNDEFAYLSAYNHLKKFFNENEFIVKDQQVNNNNTYLWDSLLITPDFMGSKENCNKIDQDINHEISYYWIDKLFTISKKTKKKEDEDMTENNNLNDASSDKSNSYNKETIIPGFILTPVLKTMSQDIYSNNYYMNIDWQLMHAKYKDKDQEIINKVTAHLATTKDGNAVDYTNFKDGQLPSDSFQFTRYSLLATPKYQQKKMFEAYFDQTKEPDQKIVFSWNKDMLGIEYFLPSDAKDSNFKIPTDSYDVPMAKNNLSLIGLQLNGINLLDLLSKKPNLQDSQSINNANNDANLKIEEKFVKYCNIETNANVSFFDNDISKNTIQNSFSATFTNSNNIQYKVETKSNMNNIQPSKSFSNNAVNFYKQVANYVDSKKILDDIESCHWLTKLINVEMAILFGILGLMIILILVRYKYSFYNGQEIPPPPGARYRRSANLDFLISFTTIVALFIITFSLFILWKFTISDPIENEVNNVKKWNNEITNESKSDINVIKKVNGEDKDNFKSIDNFMKYYEKKSNTAFASYFYYFHFVELSQKQGNNEQTIIIDKTVKDDYEKFNETKQNCGISDRNFGRIIIGILLTVLLVCSSILLGWNIISSTYEAISDWRQYVYDINNQVAQVGHIFNPNPNPNPNNPNDDPLHPQFIPPDIPN